MVSHSSSSQTNAQNLASTARPATATVESAANNRIVEDGIDSGKHTSGEGVREFLDGCGQPGLVAYAHLQLADLLYPAISGLFLACALAIVLVRAHRPESGVVAAALTAAGISVRLPGERRCLGHPGRLPGISHDRRASGLRIGGQQVCSWASWGVAGYRDPAVIHPHSSRAWIQASQPVPGSDCDASR